MMKRGISVVTVILLMVVWMTTGVFAALPEGVPSQLDAPVMQGIAQQLREDGSPYFEAQVFVPQSILDLNNEAPGGGSVFWEYAFQIDGGAWSDYGGGGYLSVITDGEDGEPAATAGNFPVTFDPIDEGTMTTIDIRSHQYTYRLRFYYDYYEGWPDVEPIFSTVSNSLTIGSGSFYAKASTWAETELAKAQELALVPEILQNADMTKPITREEFCELAVLLYEKVMDAQAVPASPNPFTDTVNPRILKAFSLGITTGTTTTTFSPKLLMNREQCATMLFRTIKAIAPHADYSVTGVRDFPDQKDISPWASEGAKYMSGLGIIKGDAAGNFMPKAVTPAQTAAGYGAATREAAVLMAVRTYEALN